MFSIRDISKRTGVKVPTNRYFEHLGLITAPLRSRGNQRRYSAEDAKRLQCRASPQLLCAPVAI